MVEDDKSVTASFPSVLSSERERIEEIEKEVVPVLADELVGFRLEGIEDAEVTLDLIAMQ